ncbi:LCP family protein [Kitasatospora mediocidica]|uniref:LCP family protein n=1 Tax=Kitasatospora mediocidica TaxID=58352 RepID=UPI00068C0193|nr:LCP family protein [Kitasatospora mediocidica]
MSGNGPVGGGDEEFEVRLSAAFGRAADGLTAEGGGQLVEGGLAQGRRRRRGRRRAVFGAMSALTVVAVGASALGVAATDRMPGRTSKALAAASKDAPPPLDHGVTILLIGLDSTTDAKGQPVSEDLRRGDLHAAANDVDVTDTLMLVHIPAGGATARQLSIPRDVLVGSGMTINQVYPAAEAAAQSRLRGQGFSGADLRWQEREAGRAALIKSVQQLVGVQVDHFAELSMAGFYQVAQAVGPVPVCLNHAVDDSWSGAHLPAGSSELDPAQALAFVRQRHGVGDGSDLARIQREQAFLTGVLHKLRTGGVLADAGKLSALYEAVKDDLVVDQGWSPVDFVRQVPAFVQNATTASTLPVQVQGNRLAAEPGKGKEILTGPAEPGHQSTDGVPCVD